MSMSNNESKFHQNQVQIGKLSFSVLISGFLALFTFYIGKYTLTVTLLVVFFLLAVYMVHSYTESLTIKDTSISVVHHFRSQEIPWNSIARIKPTLQGFLLSDSNEEVKIFVSSLVIDPWRFLHILEQKRPGLLRSEKTIFYEDPIVAVILGSAGIFMTYFSIRWMVENAEFLLQKIVVLLIGFGCLVLIAFFYKVYVFDDDKLIVKSIARSRVFHLKTIKVRSSKQMFWISRNGYSVTVDHLIGGVPAFLLTFYNWLNNDQIS